jgi:hypothetical protein
VSEREREREREGKIDRTALRQPDAKGKLRRICV